LNREEEVSGQVDKEGLLEALEISVQRLGVQDREVIVIRIPVYTQFYEAYKEAAQKLGDALAQAGMREFIVLIISDEMKLEDLDEAEMAKHGWVKGVGGDRLLH